MPSLILAPAAKEARSIAFGQFIDGDDSNAFLRIYSGVQPASPADPVGASVLLVELTCPRPISASNTNGLLVGNAFENQLATGTGNASWARLVRSDTTVVADLTVGITGSGANLELPTTAIFAGSIIGVTLFQVAEA